MNDVYKTKEQLIDELESLRNELKQLAKTRRELEEIKDYLVDTEKPHIAARLR